MVSYVLSLLSISQLTSLHCSVRREISPCTCSAHHFKPDTIVVNCEKVSSFNEVVDTLTNKFNPELSIWFYITHSQIEDLETRSFADMNMKIKNLRLTYDNLRYIPESSFLNLTHVESITLSDNPFEEIPRHIFRHSPKVKTLEITRCQINIIKTEDFKDLSQLHYVVLFENKISILEKNSIPNSVKWIHLGNNNLKTLNGTIRNNYNIEVLILNQNQLTTLDDELPTDSDEMKTLLAHNNLLKKIPDAIRTFRNLEAIYIEHNEITSLDGTLRKKWKLAYIAANHNKIKYLASDEFLEDHYIDKLELAYNFITSINGSLLNLRRLRTVNLSYNLITELSLNEFNGLPNLSIVDFSHNRIEKLSGRLENSIETKQFMKQLKLDHNFIKSLDGAIMGLNTLKELDLSFNLIQYISPDDLIGLEELEILNISHNDLQTLEEMSKTFLPLLSRLDASYNNLTKLEKDFQGLPVLCAADLSNNRISSLSPELVSHTRCYEHGIYSVLDITLEENPILCHDSIDEIYAAMQTQHARISGLVHCIFNAAKAAKKSEDSISAIQILKTQLPLDIPIKLSNSIIEPAPSILQILVQAPPQVQQLADLLPKNQFQNEENNENNRSKLKIVLQAPPQILTVPAVLESQSVNDYKRVNLNVLGTAQLSSLVKTDIQFPNNISDNPTQDFIVQIPPQTTNSPPTDSEKSYVNTTQLIEQQNDTIIHTEELSIMPDSTVELVHLDYEHLNGEHVVTLDIPSYHNITQVVTLDQPDAESTSKLDILNPIITPFNSSRKLDKEETPDVTVLTKIILSDINDSKTDTIENLSNETNMELSRETFITISPEVIGTLPDRAQQLSEPDEPPEPKLDYPSTI